MYTGTSVNFMVLLMSNSLGAEVTLVTMWNLQNFGVVLLLHDLQCLHYIVLGLNFELKLGSCYFAVNDKIDFKAILSYSKLVKFHT